MPKRKARTWRGARRKTGIRGAVQRKYKNWIRDLYRKSGPGTPFTLRQMMDDCGTDFVDAFSVNILRDCIASPVVLQDRLFAIVDVVFIQAVHGAFYATRRSHSDNRSWVLAQRQAPL